VLQGGQRLTPSVLLGKGQPGEVWSVDRESNIPFGSKGTECLTPLLLPREALDERQLEGPVAFGHEVVEILLVCDPVRREP
jgi:hypothetical protein